MKVLGQISLLLVALCLPPCSAAVIAVGYGTGQPGATVVVPISILSVTDLYSFQADIAFDPMAVQLTGITEGPFLRSSGSTFFVPGQIDNTGGTATLYSSLIGAMPGATGDGELAFLNFRVIEGMTPLTASNVILLDSTLQELAYETRTGRVIALPEPGTSWLVLLALSGIVCLKSRWL